MWAPLLGASCLDARPGPPDDEEEVASVFDVVSSPDTGSLAFPTPLPVAGAGRCGTRVVCREGIVVVPPGVRRIAVLLDRGGVLADAWFLRGDLTTFEELPAVLPGTAFSVPFGGGVRTSSVGGGLTGLLTD